jgi:hypothetical protein
MGEKFRSILDVTIVCERADVLVLPLRLAAAGRGADRAAPVRELAETDTPAIGGAAFQRWVQDQWATGRGSCAAGRPPHRRHVRP